MGLAQVQALMARLYTDEPLRERFFDDPAAVGREFALSADEIRHLAHLSERQVGLFADALRGKRLHGVAKLLPLTCEALGDRFHDLFQRYAGTYVPRGVHKHRDEALAFASYLERLARTEPLEPASTLDQLRYEIAWLRAAQPGVCCLVRYLGHWIGGRFAIAIWLRVSPRGRLRHAIWTL
jgi:hypothetical protein